MTTQPPGLCVRRITVPGTLTGSDAADFLAFAAMRNAIYAEIAGNHDEDASPDELLANYGADADDERLAWLLELDGRVVGRANAILPREEGSRSAYLEVNVLREVWGQGLGTAALAVLEDAAQARGRTVLQIWAEHPEAAGQRLTPPTSGGSIPADHVARFLQAHGYTLEQVELKSGVDLTRGHAEREALLPPTLATASGYRVVSWVGRTPTAFVERYAGLKATMSTDAPVGDLEIDEQAWDADRVTRADDRHEAAGTTLLVTCAQHEGTGELVAFTELFLGPDPSAATIQGDTLVTRQHRGHRLGTLVKLAALQQWRALAPASPRVLTWNAAENQAMLAINHALGFQTLASIGAWKKTAPSRPLR